MLDIYSRLTGVLREFQPSFNTVAKAWTKVSPVDRDQHFFATVDFDDAMLVFQKARHLIFVAGFV